MAQIRDEYSQKLSARIKKVLEERGRAFKAKYQISIPPIDLDALEKHAEEAAWSEEPVYETRQVYREWDGWDYLLIPRWYRGSTEEIEEKVGTEKKFDEKKSFEEFRSRCLKEFSGIVTALIGRHPDSKSLFVEYLEKYLNFFKEEMDSLIHAQQEDFKEMKQKEQSNQEIIAEIEELGKKRADIQPEKSRCSELLEDLKDNLEEPI